MAMATLSEHRSNPVTRLLTTTALVCMYLFGTLAVSGAALTFSAATAEAGRRGRRGRRGRWGRGFCFNVGGVGFCRY